MAMRPPSIPAFSLSRRAKIILSVLAFNLVGDGLRDAADPYSQ